MCRRVWWEPGVTVFKPSGVEASSLQGVRLSVEEAEAIRLIDARGMEQTVAAKKRRVSQPTFSRVLGSARKKIADALVEGKTIKIEGGDYVVEKGVPKRDGSGRGVQANRGRGGCQPPEHKGVKAKGNCPRGFPGRPRRRRRQQAVQT